MNSEFSYYQLRHKHSLEEDAKSRAESIREINKIKQALSRLASEMSIKHDKAIEKYKFPIDRLIGLIYPQNLSENQ